MSSEDKAAAGTPAPEEAQRLPAKKEARTAAARRAQPAASEPSSDPATQAAWSPAGYPMLVFGWSVIITDDPANSPFAVTVALDPTKAYVDPPSGLKKQVFVDTVVSAERPAVPFSLSDDSGRTPFIHGELRYEPGGTTSSLTVVSLTYPGGFAGRQVLYPSA